MPTHRAIIILIIMSIIRHIPNTITSLNLFCGTIAVILSFYGEFKIALFFMIAGAICDFCDGFAARLLKAYSPMGKELDSLADMVSFGLAPTCLAFNKMLYIWDIGFTDIFSLNSAEMFKYLAPLLCTLLIAVFSGLRLAKFNIDTRQTENFIGLATPSCALIIGSLIYSMESYPAINSIIAENTFILPLISVALSLLLVSEVPMFSFKFKSFKWAQNKLKFSFLICTAVIAAIIIVLTGSFALSIWIFTVLIFYILLNTAIYLYNIAVKK